MNPSYLAPCLVAKVAKLLCKGNNRHSSGSEEVVASDRLLPQHLQQGCGSGAWCCQGQQ